MSVLWASSRAEIEEVVSCKGRGDVWPWALAWILVSVTVMPHCQPGQTSRFDEMKLQKNAAYRIKLKDN